jgi:hypothetical protein
MWIRNNNLYLFTQYILQNNDENTDPEVERSTRETTKQSTVAANKVRLPKKKEGKRNKQKTEKEEKFLKAYPLLFDVALKDRWIPPSGREWTELPIFPAL